MNYIRIEGQFSCGTLFSVDPLWWREADRNIKELKARLEKPMLTDWDEQAQRHKVEARRVTWLCVIRINPGIFTEGYYKPGPVEYLAVTGKRMSI